MAKSNQRRGSVRQRGETHTAYWHARDEHGNSVQRTRGGFKTAEEAEKYLTTKLHEIDKGTYTEPDRTARRQTLAQFVRDTWAPAVETSLRPSTLASYRSNLELHVIPTLGACRLQEVTPDRLNRLYAELLKSGDKRTKEPSGLSTRTVRYVAAVIHRVLRDAVMWDRIARNPSERAQPPKPARKEMSSWSAPQLRAFLEHVRTDRLYAVWFLLATTGMRRGEALGLRWSDVDLDAEHVTIVQTLIEVGYEPRFSTPKTERGRRRIGLDGETITVLKAHRARQATERLAAGELWAEGDLVFTDELGRPLHPQHVTTAFKRHVKAAKLPAIRLHDVRHSYATAGLEAGIPTRIMSARLGHANTSITSDVYQHVSAEMDDRAAQHVASLILGAETG